MTVARLLLCFAESQPDSCNGRTPTCNDYASFPKSGMWRQMRKLRQPCLSRYNNVVLCP